MAHLRSLAHYNLAFVETTGTFRTFDDVVTKQPRTLPVYHAPSVDAEAMWSGKKPLPTIGDKVAINFNQLGSGVVESYFIEGEWLGVRVKLDNQPEWHRKQNPGRDYALVFGMELDLPEPEAGGKQPGPLYPHVPKSKQPLFPHVPGGQQPGTKLPATEKLYQRGPDGYPIGADKIMRDAWGPIPDPDQPFWSREGFIKPVKVYGWQWAPDYHSWRAYVRFPDGTETWTSPRQQTGGSLELLASTEGDPIRKFCCRQCGECAPKDFLEEGRFLDRISWLRSHYKEKHPGMWGKRLPLTMIEGGEPVPPQYRHLVGLVSEPLPKEAD